MPAPSAKSQHPEAWPASTYGYLRGVPDNKKLLSGTLPDNNLFHYYMVLKLTNRTASFSTINLSNLAKAAV